MSGPSGSGPTPRVVRYPAMPLAGMSFFGDPFTSHAGWTEENEIGRLWCRLGRYLDAAGATVPAVTFEVHLRGAETALTGEFEVFAGYPVPGPCAPGVGDVAVELVTRTLPAGMYVEVELCGTDIVEENPVLADWFRASGYREDGSFLLMRYDERFLGTDRLGDSVVTFAMPVRPRDTSADVDVSG